MKIKENIEIGNTGYILKDLTDNHGTLLWTNPNISSTAVFGEQNIQLNSSDYDETETIYILLNNYGNYDYRKSTGKIPYQTGKNIQLDFVDYDGNNGLICYKRVITMTNKTQFAISNAEKIYNIGVSTDNHRVVPLYIIGYNTKLFS